MNNFLAPYNNLPQGLSQRDIDIEERDIDREIEIEEEHGDRARDAEIDRDLGL